jgi:hypothetical protein
METTGDYINENNIGHIAEMLVDRKIKSCREDERMHNFFIIEFEDGSKFSMEYDWLYEWKFITNE